MILEHAVSKVDMQVYDLTSASYHHLWNRDWEEEAENLDKVAESMSHVWSATQAWGSFSWVRFPQGWRKTLREEPICSGLQDHPILGFSLQRRMSKDSSLDSWTPSTNTVTDSRSGDFGTADRCFSSLSSKTQIGQTAHLKQDALPRVVTQVLPPERPLKI